MMTVIMVFIAFAFGLLLFSRLQKDIPDELAFLRVGAAPTAVHIPGSVVQEYKGWRAVQVGETVELVKPFNGPLKVGGAAYPAPTLGILCNGGKLDTRIETHLATTGLKVTPVSVGGAPSEEWQKGTGTNVFPQDPSKALRQLAETPHLTFAVSYKTIGLQKTVVTTEGLTELLQRLPVSCRP